MEKIPASHLYLLQDDLKSFAYLATTMKDCSPQVTPVWFSFKDGYIYINSALGRTKDRNMRERPQVALAISDPQNPYKYIQIRGMVVDITENGGVEGINALSYKYHGKPYNLPQGQRRVVYKIEPEKVTVNG
jgi:PPOX class probable F420-dependent enzyme